MVSGATSFGARSQALRDEVIGDWELGIGTGKGDIIRSQKNWKLEDDVIG